MVDVYDRVHLMLTYSAQFIDEIATKLETNTKREDQVGLSSNSIGIASGLAGIAAAAAVVTPAGPPLIIASLLFGATAQASSSGSKLVNYYSAPNKIALKIISYYNLLKSILVVTNVLKDALLEGDINVEQYVSRVVKAHDEAMVQMSQFQEEEEVDENDNKDNNMSSQSQSWDKVDDLTQMAQGNSPTTAFQKGEIDFEDDWETDDDDSTIMSVKSKSSQMNGNQPLQGIKEDDDDDDDGFGEFQEADSADANSVSQLPSPSSQLSVSSTSTSTSTRKGFFSMGSKKRNKNNNNNNSRNNNSTNTNTNNKNNTTSATASPTTEALPYSNPDNSNENKTKKISETDLMERKDTAGKIARFYSRTSLAGSSLVGAASVTIFAGAALSVAHVAFEANNFATTIKRLQAGSPSRRALLLRNIKDDIKNLPQTSFIAEEWDKYLAMLDERRRNAKRNIGKKDDTGIDSGGKGVS